ncbi:MAG: YcxB family protein [Magnetococcales bacterium]|nr:YcxB family protein [Magnetococcales bacterium]
MNMDVSGYLHESEFVSAQLLHDKISRNTLDYFLYLMVVITAVLIGLVLYDHDDYAGRQMVKVLGGLVGGIVGGLLAKIVMRYLYIPVKSKRIFQQHKIIQLPFSLTWNGDELISESKQGLIRILWSDIVKWKDNDQIILIYVSDINFVVIPKRIFSDLTVLASFMDHLQIHAIKT